jgi:kynurenine formamidase
VTILRFRRGGGGAKPPTPSDAGEVLTTRWPKLTVDDCPAVWEVKSCPTDGGRGVTVDQSPQSEKEQFVRDPVDGLRFYELSHSWGHGSPTYPGFEDVQIYRTVNHAQHGVLTQRIRTVMHTGTHLNAPRYLVQRGTGVGSLPLELFFGTAAILDCPKEEWELVTVPDLERARPEIRPDDRVIIVTGWHRNYSDSQRYFAHGPGLSPEAAQWLIDRRVKLVGMDTASIDHPLATSLADHRNGPTAKYLPARYEATTGRRAKDDFPEWNPAQRSLLAAGIPTIESVGGDIDALVGERATVHAFPWRWPEGDACVIRLIGITDPTGAFRVAKGERS